jgi:ribonuclease PH
MAAVSIVQVDGQMLLDPNYHEDAKAEMDSNIVLTESGKILELQITSETKPFDAAKLAELMALADKGVKEVVAQQYAALKQR